jgi:hypothetical protein
MISLNAEDTFSAVLRSSFNREIQKPRVLEEAGAYGNDGLAAAAQSSKTPKTQRTKTQPEKSMITSHRGHRIHRADEMTPKIAEIAR